jgi:hypothetical protein
MVGKEEERDTVVVLYVCYESNNSSNKDVIAIIKG